MPAKSTQQSTSSSSSTGTATVQCIPNPVSQGSNQAAQSQLPGDEGGMCVDAVTDFTNDVGAGDLVAALTSLGNLSGEDWARLTRDDSVSRQIPQNFVMKEAIVLLDATPFDTIGVYFTWGTPSLQVASKTCNPDLVALLKRHWQGALALIGIADLADIGTLMEEIGQPITDCTQQTSSEVFEILSGMSADGRRRGMLALEKSGALDMWVVDEMGNIHGNYLAMLPAEDLPFLTQLIQGEDTPNKEVEDQAKKSENPERAAKALAELRALQGTEKADPKRLTNGIVNLLVWGVGKAMNSTDIGREGIIGIDQAVNAGKTLIGMPLEAYKQIVSTLVMAGGEKGDAKIESVLVLKALAARKKELTGSAAPAQAKASKEIADFADTIRGTDPEELKKKTVLRDTGGGNGLQQKWTMSCGPTSIQMTRGDADPIYALAVSGKSKHDLNYESDVGKEQKDYLGVSAVPRVVKTAWDAFQVDVGTWMGADLKNVPAGIALLSHISGVPATAKDLTAGKKWAAGAGYDAKRIAEFKKFYPFNEPGWDNSDFVKKANAEIASPTNAKFDERPIPPKWKKIAKKMRPISTMKKADCDALYKALFRGNDIPMGIMWYGGGGHFMVFTDCRTETKGEQKIRSFLLSDPWEGKSAWITEANVMKGNVSPFGKGAIDSIYL